MRCAQAFIPAAMEELQRVDVINQQAKFGREADFKLGTDQEIAAKVSAFTFILRSSTINLTALRVCLRHSLSPAFACWPASSGSELAP